MTRFVVWSRVERRGGNAFVAVASAIPCIEQRYGPEERTLRCDTLGEAESAAARLARALADDIHAGGGRVSADSPATVAAPVC